MSGCVTVTGPPCAICSWNIGITLPGAAEHIAEAHDDESRARCQPLQRLAHQLGQPLAGAHHVGRVDGLVGRDHHEALDAGADRRGRRASCVPSTLFTIASPGVVLFHQRHVLVGGGVEDHRRRVLARAPMPHAVRP